MVWAIRKTDTNKELYVARPKSQHSYTNKLSDIALFRLESEAEASCCIENEKVVEITWNTEIRHAQGKVESDDS